MKEKIRWQRPSFKAALRFWCKLGWISFGGTAAHIAIMHDELVEKKRWISNRSFLHALSHCMILPGPEAQHAKCGDCLSEQHRPTILRSSKIFLITSSVVFVRFNTEHMKDQQVL